MIGSCEVEEELPCTRVSPLVGGTLLWIATPKDTEPTVIALTRWILKYYTHKLKTQYWNEGGSWEVWGKGLNMIKI